MESTSDMYVIVRHGSGPIQSIGASENRPMLARMSAGQSRLPQFLRDRALSVRLGGGIPVLLAHPDQGWNAPGAKPTPRPVVFWMHGRTANKELDPGRYLRWLRAEGGGLSLCAIDLPGHGERFDARLNSAATWLEIIDQAVAEIDVILSALAEPRWNGAFDTKRAAIGGMSMGGMVAIVRLCREHPFACAAVESTAGDFRLLGRGEKTFTAENAEDAETTALPERSGPDTGGRRADSPWHGPVIPAENLPKWRPIPFLALHSEADEMVPVGAMQSFIEALQRHYTNVGASPDLVRFITWPTTGAPREHLGFGQFSNEAKNLQTEFLARALR